MGITSAQFRQRNDILFSAKVVHSDGWNSGIPGDEQTRYGVVDGLDLDGNGKLDLRCPDKTKDGLLKRTYFEPVLNATIEQIHQLAAHKGTEVLTSPNANNLDLTTYGYLECKTPECGGEPWATEDFGKNGPHLYDLVHQKAPLFDRGDATWAFDTTTDEFIVFVKKLSA